jgi:hypothetical protein
MPDALVVIFFESLVKNILPALTTDINGFDRQLT